VSANRTGGRSRFAALFKRRIKRRNFLTRLFSIGLYLLNFPRHIRKPESTRRILVFHNNYLGDTVFLSAVYKNLRLNYPNASITSACSETIRPILEADDNIDEVLIHPPGTSDCRTLGSCLRILFRWRKRGYDLIAEFHSDSFTLWLAFLYLFRARRIEIYLPALKDTIRTYRVVSKGGIARDYHPDHAVLWNLRRLESLGATISRTEVSLPVEDRWQESLREKIPELAGESRSYFVICPGASWSERQWASAKFAATADAVAEKYNLTPVIAGGSHEQELCRELQSAMSSEAVNLAGRLELTEFIALIAGARLLIGNDSGPVHAATGVGTPVVAVEGTANVHMYRPWGENVRVCLREVACGPCYAGECYMPENICLQPVTVEEVVAAAGALLGPVAQA